MVESSTEKLVASLTRRDFIKLLAGSSLGLAFAITGLDRLPSLLTNNIGNSGNRNAGQVRQAFGQSSNGSWTLPGSAFNTNITAIHAALLYTGKIVIVAGSSFNKDDYSVPFLASLYNPTTSSETNLAPMADDLFCCHQTQLPDGNILFAGGTMQYEEDPNNCTQHWRGENAVYRFNATPGIEVMQTRAPMARGRWYPTLISYWDPTADIDTARGGRVAAFSGADDYGNPNNLLVEIYNPVTNSWSIKLASGSSATYNPGDDCLPDGPSYGPGVAPAIGNYPRMHHIPNGPNGLVVTVGMGDSVRTWNPSTGVWLEPDETGISRNYGASWLLPLENTTTEKGAILVAAGQISGGGVSNTSQIIDFNQGNPEIRNAGNLSYGRRFCSQAHLPDGKCIILGGTTGSQNSGYIYVPEIFDPQTENWTTKAAATVERTYHSVALLLPNGKVWTAGGTDSADGDGELRTELFNPPYISNPSNPAAGRPSITNVSNVSSAWGKDNGTITIITPDVNDIPIVHGVSLVRLGAATHHYEPNGRLIWLQVLGKVPATNTLTAKMPLNGHLAPPGYYMIHVLNDSDIPSPGWIIKIPGSGASDLGTPIINIVSPAANQLLSGPSGNVPIPVSGTAVDTGSPALGIQLVQVKLASTDWQDASNPSGDWSNWNTTLFATSSGANTIQVQATDLAGNVTTLTIPIIVAYS